MLGRSAGDAILDVSGDRLAKRPRPGEGYQGDVPASTPAGLPDPLGSPEGAAKRQPAKKPPLSCAECRRLKLKCDRVFPCQSCSKRGCAEICPTGVLVSGRGSRFILANTEQLHAKIMQMSDRIRYLEEALEALQSSCSSQPHPLLREDLLLIKTSVELYGGPQSGHQFASEITIEGETNECPPPIFPSPFHLPETEAYDKAYDKGQAVMMEPNKRRDDGTYPDIPDKLLQLSRSFPVPWDINLDTRESIRDMLPSRPEAQLLCEQARQNALWQYNLDPSEVFLPNLLHHVYTAPVPILCPRRVALLLMILAIGSSVGLNQPVGSPRSQMYHHLARASLCEIPLMQEPSFDLLQALFFMMWYLLSFSDTKKGLDYAWTLMGTTVKLAQLIGLHRDSRAGSKVIPEELERRRTLFWEIVNLDTRLSLSLGRPSSLSLFHVDCKSPSYALKGNYCPAEGAFYHEWKHTFVVRCLSPILEAVSSAVEPEYQFVIALDRSVRDFHVPRFLDIFNSEGMVTTRSVVMQRAAVSSTRETALLQLHRSYFVQALSGPEPFTLRHKFVPSVVAIYRSASWLISTMEVLFSQEPHLSARFMCFWFNSFSAGVFLCLLVLRAPCSTLVPFALHELQRVCRLFEKAKELPFVCKMLPRLLNLTEKAHRIYSDWMKTAKTAYSPMEVEANVQKPSSSIPTMRPQTLPQLESLESLEHVHPALRLCLENASRKIEPNNSVRDCISHSVEPTISTLWLQPIQAQRSRDSYQKVTGTHDSTRDDEDVDPLTPKSRINEHQSFNFEFGTLAHDLGDLDLTSWF